MSRRRANHPKLPRSTDLIAHLLTLTPEWRHVLVQGLAPDARLSLDRDWPSWAHDGQVPPPADGDWRTWVILAGRGFGKTLAGAQWITAAIGQARRTDNRLLIALVGATLDDARRVMIEGNSGLLNVAAAHIAHWWPSRRLLQFSGGSEAVLFSGASPESLRGPEHHLAWCDELAKWEKPGDCWDMLQLGLRLGQRPRTLVTTTPKPGDDLARIMAQPDTIVTGGATRANPHLPAAFKTAVYRLYANTRLGKQELDGEVLTDTPGALWTVELLERARIPLPSREGLGVGASEASPRFTRILIGVDPPSGGGTCGIVACALDEDGIGHVLADHSIGDCSPETWATKVATAARAYEVSHPAAAVRVLAEINQGGAMVGTILRNVDPFLRLKTAHARHAKTVRAEPVAMLFEQGRVRLHGRFPALEAELLRLIAGQPPNPSPDRADAMIWALTDLMVRPRREPRVEQF